MGYGKIIKLVDDSRFLDADQALSSVSTEEYESNAKLADLLGVMINSEIKSRYEQQEFLRKLRKKYRDEVFDLYFQLVRMDLLLKNLESGRLELFFSLLETKFREFEEDNAFEMYLMSKAEYFYDIGDYDEALSILESFDGDRFSCPLMYYELLAQVFIKRHDRSGLKYVTEKVDEISEEHKPLTLDKQETYLSIKIKIALYKKEMIDSLEHVNGYISVLDQIQRPFGYNHLELCVYLSELGYSKREIRKMTSHYIVTEVSLPYLRKRDGLKGEISKNPNHVGEILIKR